ncbi:MAG: GGDEF domain-containing protein [Erythrobacter sp.]
MIKTGGYRVKMHFNDVEGRVLHGLIEDSCDDIVVRLDASGFIIHASVNAGELGIDPSALLLLPHIADLAEPEYASELDDHVRRVLAGEAPGGWIEFPLRVDETEDAEDAGPPVGCRRWYAFSLRLIDHDDGVPQGALGLLRPVQNKHASGSEWSSHAAHDPHTGLANRHAFCGALARGIERCENRSVAIFAVDRMRAIFMQYGQATADEIRWGFARFLETMTGPDQELALIDEERFGVLLPDMELRAAREWASDVLQTFAGLTTPSCSRAPELTASAGLARVEISVDWTLRQAELGLVMARAGGGMQAAVCRSVSGMSSGEMVERAMEAAVQRALEQDARRRA